MSHTQAVRPRDSFPCDPSPPLNASMLVAYTLRFRGLLLATLILPLPWIVYALGNLGSNTTDMAQWVPDSDPEKQRHDRFVDTFGLDDFVVLSWPEGTLDNPQVRELEACLTRELDETPPEKRLARLVTSGPTLIDDVMQSAKIGRSEAIERLRGLVIGEQDLTCVLVSVSRFGRDNPAEVVEYVSQCAESCGIPRGELRLGGSVCQVTSIDVASMTSMRRLFLPSALVACAISLLCMRSISLAAICMILGGYAAALSLAMLYYAGRGLNGVLIVLPTLIYVLTVSGAVHMINYYVDCTRRFDPLPAIRESFRLGWKPCTLAIVTTCIGLSSLVISGLRPVREFGAYTTLGLIGGLVLLLVYLPVLLAWFERSAVRSSDITAHSFCRRFL